MTIEGHADRALSVASDAVYMGNIYIYIYIHIYYNIAK